MTFQQLRANYANNPVPPQQGLGIIARELKQAKVLRAVMSRRQLAEVLVDFWMNHFNVAAGSSQRTKYDISPYDRIALRPNVLGNFENLLVADAKSPAMGDYLDNRRNRVNAHQRELRARGARAAHRQRERPVHRDRRRPSWRAASPAGRRTTPTPSTASSSTPASTTRARRRSIGRRDPAQRRHQGRPHDARRPGAPPEHGAVHQPQADRSACVSETPAAAPRRRGGRRVPRHAAATCARSSSPSCMSPEFLTSPQYRKAKVKRPLVFFASAGRALGRRPDGASTPTTSATASPSWARTSTRPGRPPAIPTSRATGSRPARREARQRRRGDEPRHRTASTSPIRWRAAPRRRSSTALAGVAVPRRPISSETRGAAIGFLDVLPEPDATTRIRQAAAVLLSSPEFLTH